MGYQIKYTHSMSRTSVVKDGVELWCIYKCGLDVLFDLKKAVDLADKYEFSQDSFFAMLAKMKLIIKKP